MVARSVRWRGRATRLPPVSTRRRSPNRARSSSTDSTLIRAAASSMANGMPSRRWQISASGRAVGLRDGEARQHGSAALDEQPDRFDTGPGLPAAASAPGRAPAAMARDTSSRRRWPAARGWSPGFAGPARRAAARPHRSRRRRSGARSCPAPAATAFRTDGRPTDPAAVASLRSRRPSAAPTACGTSAGSVKDASSTHQTPSSKSDSSPAAASSASRVLPAPPEPVSVSRRVSPSSRLTSAISRSRPMKLVSWSGRLSARTERSDVCQGVRWSGAVGGRGVR